MKKVAAILIASILFFSAADAQYVNIPDSNFRNYLHYKYPSCFNSAGKMDTSCNLILNASDLYIEFATFNFDTVNLEGVQYFKNLQALQITSYPFIELLEVPKRIRMLQITLTQINNLPQLPDSLENLICDNLAINSLPPLPQSLKYLQLSFCRNLQSLPQSLPAGLQILSTYSCSSITNLPVLPDSLLQLNFTSNDVSILPPLPATLTILNCGGNRLSYIPPLPNGLLGLDCSGNSIRSLPSLPPNLGSLLCSGNPLYNLPALPNSLTNLYCSSDSLTILPNLPQNLRDLRCSKNQLTSLGELPNSVGHIECENNNIYCFPKLPIPTEIYASYTDIYFDGDKIKCIPNYTSFRFVPFFSNPNTVQVELPVCNPTNNSNHCQSFPVIQGTAYYDYNNSNIRDANELVKKNVKVILSNGSYTFTNNNGLYQIAVDTIGNYNVIINPPQYWNVSPAAFSVSFAMYDTLLIKDIALQANASVDSLSIYISPLNSAARPGFSFPYLISYENIGTTSLSANIVFDYDQSRLTYNTSSVSGVVDNNNILTYNTGALLPGQSGSFIGYFTVKTTVPLGDTLNAKATISVNMFAAHDSVQTIVRGAFDPNDKEATPQLSPSQVAAGKYINYTIRFQNTGTDTAFNVVISDTLNGDLQASTLQMLTASHTCKTTVKDGIAYFEFLNILLPDSNVNELKSHGFVTFKMQAKSTVAANTIIPNKAAIYFDYNSPVITNTATTLIKDFIVVPLHLVSFSAIPQNDNTTTLYWTTANEINTKSFVIEQSVDGRLFNGIGTILAQGRASNSYSKIATDVPNALMQFYRIKMIDINGQFSYTPIIKISRRKTAAGFSLLSNPVKDWLNITTTDAALYNSSASIVNSNGAIVKGFMLQQGVQNISVNGLPAGVYYLRTESGSVKFVITK